MKMPWRCWAPRFECRGDGRSVGGEATEHGINIGPPVGWVKKKWDENESPVI